MIPSSAIPYQIQTSSSIDIGCPVFQGVPIANATVQLVLKSLTRHGLIAGATGTGKTKTLQVLVELLSKEGIPSFVMDMKGDLSGLSMKGEPSEAILTRSQKMGLSFNPMTYFVEFFSIDDPSVGVPIRSTVDGYGSELMARLLGLNETQTSILTLVFDFAKQNQESLRDLKDLKQLLQLLQNDYVQSLFESQYGTVAASSIGTILRSVLRFEATGGGRLFGTPMFNVSDFCRRNTADEGLISVLRLMNEQTSPAIFSTLMLKIVSDIFLTFPEVGDVDKPKLMIFIDEAHLIFEETSATLLSLLERMIKLIRSKGVGLIFCTQTPDDIPNAILGQLGLKIQHALRAFTAKDRKAINLMAQNFPISADYDVAQLLTTLPIGEALLSALDGQGQPLPLLQVMMKPPLSRMGVVTSLECERFLKMSQLMSAYANKDMIEDDLDARMRQKLLMKPKVSSGNASTTVTKMESSKSSDMLTSLSKNTLIRQIARQTLKQVTSWVLRWLKK